MALNFSLFHNPQYGGLGICHSWLTQASRINDDDPYSSFQKFVCLWTAFNSWGMCVSLVDRDSQMIEAVVKDPELNRIFLDIVNRTSMRDWAAAIQHNFPLPSFSDLIRVDPSYDWRGERDEQYWRKIETATKRVRKSPCLDANRLNLEDTLWCIYKVRCNLVHGGKMASRNEANFVSVISNMLEALLTDGTENFLDLGRS